jgi:glyoxylase-like metal-dependent hydrolase (beta-lactamase superfamily II)
MTNGKLNIIHVGYDSTNYYLLINDRTGLLVDVGWPGTLPKLQHILSRRDLTVSQINYLVITHYHPDHAGLAQEVKNEGVKLVVLETQPAFIPALKAYMKPINPYVDIQLDDNIALRIAASRDFLRGLGIQGEIIATPGHSDDSISLVLDDGSAFTGDLPPPLFAADDAQSDLNQSWEKLRALGVKTIYPGHGPARPMP